MTSNPQHPLRILASAEQRRSWSKFTLYLLLLAPLAIFICFYNLGDKSFGIPDESSHIQATQGMVMSGNYLQPRIGARRYFNKPPFKMWLSLIPVQIMGESNFSYRFLDGLLGCGTTLLVYLLGFVLFRSWSVGFAAALALLGCRSYVFTHGIRSAVQDGMLMMLTTLAMLIGWVLVREFIDSAAIPNSRRKKLILAVAFGTTIGCAVYTKTVAGFLGVIMLGAFMLFSGKLFRILRALFREGVIAAVLAVAIPATYFAPHLLFTKGAAQVMLGHEVVERATSGLHNQGNLWFYFIRLFPDRAAVPPELLILAVLMAGYLIVKQRDFRFLYLLVWAIFPVVFFTLIPSRLTWYIAPAFPAMSLLVGFLVCKLTILLNRSWRSWIAGARHETRKLIPLGLVWTYSVSAIAFHLIAVGSAVAVSHTRIALDELVEQLQHNTPTTSILVMDEPRYSYREQTYRNMLETRVRKIENFNELISTAKALSDGIILTDAKNFYTLFSQLPVLQYRLVRPKEERKQWLSVIVFGKELPLAPMRLTERTLHFADPDFPKLFGFSEPTTVSKRGVRLSKGPDQAFYISGDWPEFRLGLDMSLTLGAANSKAMLTVFINSYPVLTDFPLKSSADSQELVTWRVPPEIVHRGDNVIQFHLSGSETGDKTAQWHVAFDTLRLALPKN